MEHRGEVVHSVGELPQPGNPLPPFVLTNSELTDFGPEVAAGKRLVLNIFPSIDTRVCALSVRRFNELAAALENTVVACVSADLPMAQARFCGAEGITDVIVGSSFRTSFGADFGVTLIDGPMRGLLSRAVVVADSAGRILYTEQVANISNEPDYEAALASLV